jgi:hypothetical protein
MLPELAQLLKLLASEYILEAFILYGSKDNEKTTRMEGRQRKSSLSK